MRLSAAAAAVCVGKNHFPNTVDEKRKKIIGHFEMVQQDELRMRVLITLPIRLESSQPVVVGASSSNGFIPIRITRIFIEKG